jgi:site-specific DNA recombinase
LENLKTHELALEQRLQLLDVESFTNQVDQNVNYLDIKEKKKILRLLVKEIVVGDDIIEIKHSIPLQEAQNENKDKSYQLCKRGKFPIIIQHIP